MVTPMLVTPRVALPPPQALAARELQQGRHPLGVGCNQVGVSFLDRSTAPASLQLATFSRGGVAKGVVEFGTVGAGVDQPSPSLAGLPDDTFVVAWTDFDADELGVRLRRVDPAATTLSAPIFANLSQDFAQRDPDVVFDGTQVIAAWVDDSDPFNGPDVRYRTFSPDLEPTSDDLTLAATGAMEDRVVLATQNGVWAAAWRSGSGGFETIEVQSGSSHWYVGPFLPGAADDRPALVVIDATHLAIAFTEGSHPSTTGVANVSRLHGAVLDAAYPGKVESFSVPQTVAPWAGLNTLSQTEPTLSYDEDHLLLGWHTSLVSGDPTADELWTREVKWSIDAIGALLIDTSSPDMPMVADSARRVGDQTQPALLTSPLWPQQSVISAWQDSGQSFVGASERTDVALQFSKVQSRCSAATLTYNHTNKYAVKGEPFVWTATSVCNGATEYRFVLRRPDGVWIEAQPWGASPTFTWDTANVATGVWNAQVWVRDRPNGNYEVYKSASVIVNDYAACTSATLSSDAPGNYGVVGNTVHFTVASECAGPAYYQFLLAPYNVGYTVAQDWSTNNTFSWDTTGQPIGYWNVYVAVSDAPFYFSTGQTYTHKSFILNTYAACTAVALTHDDADNRAQPGQVVHWTATPTCAGPAEYLFQWRRPDGVWVEMQPWGPSNTFTWDTTGQLVGGWNMRVSVRDAPFYNGAQTYSQRTFTLAN